MYFDKYKAQHKRNDRLLREACMYRTKPQIEFLYDSIVCKQWLLPTEAVQFVYRHHNGQQTISQAYHCDVNTDTMQSK